MPVSPILASRQPLSAQAIEDLIEQSTLKLDDTFCQLDQVAGRNLARVLAAFRAERVGSHHFGGVAGYGHGDTGRDTMDKVFAQAMGAEAAIVRLQMVSGTHAIACALFGVLRPGDELLMATGSPYDTLEEVIGIRGNGQGSLREFGVSYRQIDLSPTGEPDWQALATAVGSQTRVVHIQRSCGYSWRPSLNVETIGRIVELVKAQNPNVICFVDNCYGEFVEDCEPPQVGADLIAGSLIKNPGGTIAPAGGYVAGRAEWVEQAACRLTAPGIGSEGGATFDQNRLLFQGLFLAPPIVAEAVKIAHLAAQVFQDGGYAVMPQPGIPRTDIIQAIQLGSPAKLRAFCKAVQHNSPIESYVEPIPEAMPGYDDAVVMAGGTFIEGSSIELSADGPMRDPYVVFLQGGTHLSHGKLVLAAAIEALQAMP